MRNLLVLPVLILLTACLDQTKTASEYLLGIDNTSRLNAPQAPATQGQVVGTINVRPSEDQTVLPEVTITPGAQGSTPSNKQLACLTEAIYFEAKGTGRKGMRAVGEVIINRKNDGRFPNTICGVVDQRYRGACQFSYRCDGKPEVYRNRAQKALAQEIATELLTNRGQDMTNGALYFHSARIAAGWFGTLSSRGQFGGNKFYR